MKRRNALIAASASLLTLGLGGLAACSETKLQLKGVDMTGADTLHCHDRADAENEPEQGQQSA